MVKTVGWVDTWRRRLRLHRNTRVAGIHVTACCLLGKLNGKSSTWDTPAFLFIKYDVF